MSFSNGFAAVEKYDWMIIDKNNTILLEGVISNNIEYFNVFDNKILQIKTVDENVTFLWELFDLNRYLNGEPNEVIQGNSNYLLYRSLYDDTIIHYDGGNVFTIECKNQNASIYRIVKE